MKAYAAKPANGFVGMTYGKSFYQPMLEVFDYLKANGFTYYVISMRDDFRTIYGFGVEKVDFTFPVD